MIAEGCWVFSSMMILHHNKLQVSQRMRFGSEGVLDQLGMKKLGLNLGKPRVDLTSFNMGHLLRTLMEEDTNQKTH